MNQIHKIGSLKKIFEGIYTLSTSNRLTFEDMCPILLKAFQSLSKGLLYLFSNSFLFFFFFETTFFSCRLYCSYLREYVYVDGDIFLLPGDNERSAQYSSTSTSCNRFCRFGDVLISSLKFNPL